PQNLSEIASRSGAGRRVRNDYLLGSLSLLGSFLFNYLSIQPFNYFSIGAKRLSLRLSAVSLRILSLEN
ncbi:hypothetical protein KAW18_11350, partial [candidate division WOR-3 bacterium]|nr:hypothetical protein [candidate division WOR-3 bacterium]